MANQFVSEGTDIMLKAVRITFAKSLWVKSKPVGADASAKEKYSATFLLRKDHPQFAALEAAAIAEAKKLFGAKWESTLKAAKLQQKYFLRDGETKPDYDGFEGNWFAVASNQIKPSVYGYNPKDGVVDQENSGIYSGVWVNVALRIQAYDVVAKGVKATLRGVQLIPTPPGEDDSALGGGTSAGEDEFEEIGVSADADPLVA